MFTRLRLLVIAVVAAVVLVPAAGSATLFASYEATYEGRIYPGVSALGVDLSGQTGEEARRLLQQQTAEMASRPVVLSALGREWDYSAAELGLVLDPESLVQAAMAVGRQDSLTERAWTLWQLRRNGHSLETIVPSVNRDSARSALAELAPAIDRPNVDAALAVSPELQVLVTTAETGYSLDQAESLRRLEQALSQGNGRVDLAVAEIPPAVHDHQVATAAAQARNLLSGPLTIYYQERSWSIAREELASLLRLDRQADGSIEARLDHTPLRELADAIARQIQQMPIDARFNWAGGRLEVIRPSRPGLTLEPGLAVEAMATTAFSPNRLVELPVVVVPAATPMEDRHNLGIVELIEQSTTSFAGSGAAKRHNIRLAAERLNGVVVPPGESFSFNESVGPTTLDAGFRWGFGILSSDEGPRTVPAVAGGICQVSTTLFQSVFWAGYTIEERYPHLYWIPSYISKGIEGIETTVAEEYGLDFRFNNPTGHHVLIQSWTDNSDRLHFALYGTKPDWTVRVEGPIKGNIRPTDHTPVEEEDPTMRYPERIVVEAARDGFDVRVIRHVTWGDETRTLTLISHYQPSRNVTLVGTLGRPTPTPTPTEAETPPAEATPSSEAAPAADEPTPAPAPATPTPAPAQPTPTPAPAA